MIIFKIILSSVILGIKNVRFDNFTSSIDKKMIFKKKHIFGFLLFILTGFKFLLYEVISLSYREKIPLLFEDRNSACPKRLTTPILLLKITDVLFSRKNTKKIPPKKVLNVKLHIFLNKFKVFD